MEKKKVSFNISTYLVRRLNEFPRSILPNKSKLVEELLEKWCDEREKTIYAEKE